MRGVLLRTTVVGALLLAARVAFGADAAIGLPPGPPPYGPPPSYGPPPFGPPPDIAVPTLFHFWNGLYIGGSGGWGWTSTKGLNAEGDFGGAQVGYNYQTGNFVLASKLRHAAMTDIAPLSFDLPSFRRKNSR
jgi:hypothetical protein